MEEDLNIIQSQCSITDRGKAGELYENANQDVALAIAMFLDPTYTSPTIPHHHDGFSEIRQVLHEKDIMLQENLNKKRENNNMNPIQEQGEEDQGNEEDVPGVEENKGC